MDINKYGVASITVGKKILNEGDFLPIKDFNEKAKYDFPVDESDIYFLKKEVIKKSPLFGGVDNLFVILDDKKEIKGINVFLNFEIPEVVGLMNSKLGEYRLSSTSGLPGYRQTESYVWTPDSNIRFSLAVNKYIESTKTEMRLLIYPSSVTTPGELSITERRYY